MGNITAYMEDVIDSKGQPVPVQMTETSEGSGVYVLVPTAPSLPAGAATAAKQPALGTAGTPSADVLSVQGVTGGKVVPVGGTTFTVSASLTRPNNANLYAQYDIIAHEPLGTNVIFLDFDTGRVDGSGYITKARLVTNRAAEAAQYRLVLFRVPETGLTTRLTNLGDNDIYPMMYANAALRAGAIDFTTWMTGGAGSDSAESLRDDLRIKYGLASGSSHLYGALINPAAGNTPAALQQYTVFLSFESNT